MQETTNVIGQLFLRSGKGKVKSACDHISYLVDSGCKFLVFAHHQVVLEALENHVQQKLKVRFADSLCSELLVRESPDGDTRTL